MSCCAAGTNRCLDLRRRAAALDGRVSVEWSRCPGSMARRPRGSVGPLRRSSAGWMPARIGSIGVARGGQRGHGLHKFLEKIAILCFERRFSKQNSVICLKSDILAPSKFLGWLRH